MFNRNDRARLERIEKEIAAMANQLSDLEALLAKDLTDLTTAVQTETTTLTNLNTQLQAALAQIAAGGGVAPADLAALQAVATGMETATGNLNKANAAVTPPPPVPAP